MIYTEQPADFDPRFEVVGCFLEHAGTFLLLHRHDHKPQGNTWCLPGGKVEPDEIPSAAVAREVWEETGHRASPDTYLLAHSLFVRYPEYDFVYHVFSRQLAEPHEVQLEESAHKNFRWVTPEEALLLPLIPGEDTCIRSFYRTTES